MTDEPLTLFEQAGSSAGASDGAFRASPARAEFLTGMLATWAASDREPGAKPTAEELRRARAGAAAALGEILR